MKRYEAKSNISPFRCHLFSRASDFLEAKKLATE